MDPSKKTGPPHQRRPCTKGKVHSLSDL